MYAFYEEKKVGYFHALVLRGQIVEEYDIRFIELVKYVSYMKIDQHQVYLFVYRLNRHKIRALMWMWKPYSVVEAVENDHYANKILDIKGVREGVYNFSFHSSWDLWGRLLEPSPMEEILGHVLMEIELHPKLLQKVFQL